MRMHVGTDTYLKSPSMFCTHMSHSHYMPHSHCDLDSIDPIPSLLDSFFRLDPTRSHLFSILFLDSIDPIPSLLDSAGVDPADHDRLR